MSDLAQTSALLTTLADPIRLRIVSMLAKHELSVAEVQEVLELAQSRVSTHLALLREHGLVSARREGRLSYYAAAPSAMEEGVRTVWAALSLRLDDELFATDEKRVAALIKKRQATSSWPERVAGEMERHYSPGRTWEATCKALLGLSSLGDVLDVGAGDGALSSLLLPHASSITLLDVSERMIAAARTRLSGRDNAHFQVGDACAMPFEAERFDIVLLFNLVTCVAHPQKTVREAARVLRPGGRIVLVTLLAHTHLDVTSRFGHIRAGFSTGDVKKLFKLAELDVLRCEVTSRETREPHLEVITAAAQKPPQATQARGKRP